MNNIVAIDTSTEACSVALQCNDSAIYRYRVEPRVHARVLFPMLNELLAEAGITTQQIDGVAFGRGPGAFTGVRIATAAAQAIALGGDFPVAPVSTLAAIAHRCHREHGHSRVAVAIDARMSEVYWGAYQIHNAVPLLHGSERVCDPSAVDALDGDWCAAGTGWQTYGSELEAATGVAGDLASDLASDSASDLADDLGTVDPFPHALDILAIGAAMLKRGEGVSAESALPVYLRDNVALTEEQRRQRE